MSTEHDPLNPVFAWRLKAALDRVKPPASLPRYASASMGLARPWRVAPFLLAAAMVVLLALTATATTGSPNPAVWTQDAASIIRSVGHAPETIPSPPAVQEQAPAANPSHSAPAAPAPAATHQPQHGASPTPEPSEQPQESPRPEPSDSSSQWSGHWGSGNTTQTSGSQRHSHSRDDH